MILIRSKCHTIRTGKQQSVMDDYDSNIGLNVTADIIHNNKNARQTNELTLLNYDLATMTMHGKHGIKYVTMKAEAYIKKNTVTV